MMLINARICTVCDNVTTSRLPCGNCGNTYLHRIVGVTFNGILTPPTVKLELSPHAETTIDTHSTKCMDCGRVGMILYDENNDVYSCKCGSENLLLLPEE